MPMKQQTLKHDSWRDIELHAQEVDVRLLYAKVALVFNLFGDHRSTTSGTAVLDRWLQFMRPSEVHVIDKDGRSYKRLTDKLLTRVRARLVDPAAGPARYEFFHFKDTPGLAIGDTALELFLGATPASKGPNRVVAVFPLDVLDDSRIETVASTFAAWVDEIPFQHGTAGLGFNLGYGEEYESDVRPAMMAAGRRYLGIDVRTRLLEPALLGRVKGPGWLTYLRGDLLERLGGPERLRSKEFATLQQTPLKHGVLLRSDRKPPVGDVNRGADDIAGLRLINRFIKPIRQEQFIAPLSFGIDEVEGAAWLARFDQ